MKKLPSTGIVKYHVKLKFEVDGLVEKADIIGAIFGQTEGLLGPEMNLNELQKVSKVGRIEVNVETKGNMTKGDAQISMSTTHRYQCITLSHVALSFHVYFNSSNLGHFL